jgi:hypothetical protein
MLEHKENEVKEVIVIYGVPSTGKTTMAKKLAKYPFYKKTPKNEWWCGYVDQKTIIMDEFRGDQMEIAQLLSFLESGDFRLNPKGQPTVLSKAEQIIICSNYHPHEWYPGIDQKTKNALNKRIKCNGNGQLIHATTVYNDLCELPVEKTV